MKTFTAIKKFVNDLGECFASEIHSLALYDRLLSKTTLEHTDAVEKHLSIFRDFINLNNKNIIDRVEKFEGNISFSPKVYINMNEIFSVIKDDETRKAVWDHLSLLVVLFNPDRKQDIAEKMSESLTSSEEDKLLNKIIQGVSNNVKEGDTPQSSLTRILSSDLLPNLMNDINSGMSKGTFDLEKMLTSVNKMAGGLNIDPQTKNMMKTINKMTGRKR